jgi:hypothetical protein
LRLPGFTSTRADCVEHIGQFTIDEYWKLIGEIAEEFN